MKVELYKYNALRLSITWLTRWTVHFSGPLGGQPRWPHLSTPFVVTASVLWRSLSLLSRRCSFWLVLRHILTSPAPASKMGDVDDIVWAIRMPERLGHRNIDHPDHSRYGCEEEQIKMAFILASLFRLSKMTHCSMTSRQLHVVIDNTKRCFSSAKKNSNFPLRNHGRVWPVLVCLMRKT